MKRISVLDKNISPNQRRLRLMELGGIPISEREKKGLQPRKKLLNEVGIMLPMREIDVIGKEEPKEDDFDLQDIIDELESEMELEEILHEMGYYDEDDEVELDELHDVKVSKGYKEGRKLVDKLRRELFRKLNDDELEDFMGVLKTSFGLK